MPNITDEKYLIGSMIDMIGSEIARISCLKLASGEEIKTTIETINGIVKTALKSEETMVLRDLIKLHRHLSKIKLPGDYVQIDAKLGDLFNITVSMQGPDKSVKPKTKKEKKPEPELEDDNKDKEFEIIKIETLAKLEKIAYDLGSKGNHKLAFLVERHINTIKDILL